MSNLKGASFDKQIRDARSRLNAIGQKRYLKEDHLTHSVELAKKRAQYLQDFRQFIEQKGITEGKLNTYMTQENVTQFLQQRIVNLSPKTQLDYITGFSSLLQGLQEANVTLPIENPSESLKELRTQARELFKEQSYQTGREIKDLGQKLEQLRLTRFESYIVARTQAELGLRVSEAYELVKNFDKYYNKAENIIEGLKGKGNHIYNPKQISKELAKEIKQIEKENIPSYSTYMRDLKSVGIEKSHDFRVTYAKQELIQKLEQGKEYKEALKEVSQEINHHREEITTYYVKRA